MPTDVTYTVDEAIIVIRETGVEDFARAQAR